MKYVHKTRRMLAALLMAVMLLSAMPAAVAESFSAFVTSGSMAVYADASLSQKLGTLEKYTVVTVKDYSGGVAKISANGRTGYAKISAMERVDKVAVEATVNTSTKVYREADTDSDSARLSKGTKVNVIAVNGKWALIEKNGIGGYTYVKYLTKKGEEAQPTAKPTAAPTVKPTATPAPTAEIDLSDAIPAVVTASSVKVYKNASTSSTVLGSLGKGTELNVVKTNGSWAMVERKGAIGYCKVSALTPKSQYNTPAPTAVPTATPAPTAEIDLSDAIPAVVTASSVKVYKNASTSSTVLGSLGKGTELNVVKTNGSWAMVERKGAIGYCKVSALTPKSQYNTPAPTAVPTATPAPTAEIDLSDAIPAVVTASSVKVYKNASTSSTVLGSLGKGTELNVVKTNGSWAMVERNGAIGYCKVSALTPKSQYNTPAPTAVPTATPAPTAEIDLSKAIPAVVTASSVKVYKTANTSSTVLGRLGKGTELNVIKTSGSWAMVERNGAIGYCKVSALTPKSQMATPVPSEKLDKPADAKVSASSVKVYKEASTSSDYLGTIKKNTEVTIVARTTDGVWAQIKRGSNIGWCKMSALKIVDPLEGFTKAAFGATVVVNDAKFYALDSDDSGVKVPFGTEVTVGAYNKEKAFVQYGSKTGFIAISALSRTEYSVLSKGSTGSAVSTLEKALLAGGYFDAKPDSTFDGNTEAAVKRFQSACGQSATGVAGQSVQRMLYSGNGPVSSLLSATLNRGNSGENVTRLQCRLYSLGYISKTSNLDGSYGNGTANAVALFQDANKLSVTGVADPATLRKLYSTSAKTLPAGKNPADLNGVVTNPTTGTQKNNSTSISSTLASITSKYNSGMSAAEKLEYVIYVGQNQLGKPYVYGANGTKSYDCTGFTVYCFKQVGVSLPRTAQNQGYNTKYERITKTSQLRRGDLVYFNTISDGDLSDHAGIYLGAGWFIHASSGQGKVVISTLSSGYYNRVFSWGHRPLG